MKRNREREITDKSEEGKRLENHRKTSRVRDVKDRQSGALKMENKWCYHQLYHNTMRITIKKDA